MAADRNWGNYGMNALIGRIHISTKWWKAASKTVYYTYSTNTGIFCDNL